MTADVGTIGDVEIDSALRDAILAYLGQVRVSDSLLRGLETELRNTCQRGDGSVLFSVFRYATKGILDVTISDNAGPVGMAVASRTTLVRDLKRAAEAKTSVPVGEQHMFYGGRLLADTEVIACFATPLDPVFQVIHAALPMIYVVGGLKAGEALVSMEAYDPSIGRWSHGPSTTRPCASTAAVGKSLVALGNVFEPDARAQCLELGSHAWLELPPMPHATELFESVVLDCKLYVLGGRDATGVVTHAQELDVDTKVWRVLEPMPVARYSFAAVGRSGFVFAIGGKGSDEQDLATAQMFSVEASCWKRLGRMDVARHSLAVLAHADHVYAIGGARQGDPALGQISDGQPWAGVEALDCASRVWAPLPSMAWPRRACAAAVVADRLCVAGGVGLLGEALVSAEVLDLNSADAWAALPDMAVPRKGFGAIPIEGKIYIFGGGDISESLTSAEVLEVSAGSHASSWTPLAPMSQPRGGIARSAVVLH